LLVLVRLLLMQRLKSETRLTTVRFPEAAINLLPRSQPLLKSRLPPRRLSRRLADAWTRQRRGCWLL
jgi:hypothetical protein